MHLLVSKKNPVTPLLYQILLVVITAQIVSAYNLDVKSPVVLKPSDQKDIQFGFSLAHVFNGTERRLLVGAPLANTTQVNVSTPGALYSCGIDKTPPECTQLRVDNRNANDKYKSWITSDLKDDQRLGYTLAANEDNVVVCAPRWHAFEDVLKRLKDLPLGICFKADAPTFNNFRAFSPAYLVSSSRDLSFINNGSCQFGMSVTNFKDSNSVGFGSPGCWNWQGDIWNIDINKPDNNNTYKRVMKLSLNDVELTRNPNLQSIVNGRQRYATPADLYLGYSIASMTYGGLSALVSAMPRTYSTNDLLAFEQEQVLGPMVYIFEIGSSSRLRVFDRIRPPMHTEKKEATLNTMFSYFGYSLTTADVDGDELDDVIVGAPFYHSGSHNDQGAIFVYMQHKFETTGEVDYGFEMKQEENAPKRMGTESYCRFGSALAAIGDLDGDGYQDIAVGAPFLDGGGAVFIYFGSSSGLEHEPRQVIRASEFPAIVPPGSGFGFSIAQRLPDKSKRSYELAVGAHNSDVVIVFKSKDVAVLSWNMTFLEKMDLTVNKCIYTGTPAGSYPCVQAKVCLLYKMNSATTSKDALNFDLKLQADVNYPNKRLFFENGKADYETQVKLYNGVTNCINITIHAEKDLVDVVSPFEIRGEVSFGKGNGDGVILDPRISLTKWQTLDILFKCKGNNATLCKSDLRLTSTVMRNHTLGSSEPVIIYFLVENKGEPAYNTRLMITSLGDLKYQKSGGNINCEDKELDMVECNIGVIFTNTSRAEFNLSLTTSEKFANSLDTHKDYFEVTANLSTSSEVASPESTSPSFNISIRVDGTLDVTRMPSSPEIVNYNSSAYYKSPSEAKSEEELGPQVLHIYKIFNSHKYNIYKSNITIQWPLKIDGKYLLYLMDMPSFNGSTPNCHYTNGVVNEFNLTKENDTLKSPGNFSRGPSVEALRLGSALNFPGSGIDDKKVEYMEFRCTLNLIKEQAEISITLRSRLVLRTIPQLEVGSALKNVSSGISLQVLQLPLGAPPPPPSPQFTIWTDISYANDSLEYQVPWWVYLLGVLGGFLILAIATCILWKCGFFKRNKSPEVVDGTDGAGDGEGDAEKENEDDPETPTSPMMKETEPANEDFEYRDSKNLEAV